VGEGVGGRGRAMSEDWRLSEMNDPIIKFQRIRYDLLNARQKEAFNFQKVSAVLADYGYITILLSSDWAGADFIALHLDGTTRKVQLKGRFTIDKKYLKQDLYICFRDGEQWFIYPHDELVEKVLATSSIAETESWMTGGGYSFPGLSAKLRELLQPYKIEERAD
jgi:hypothetical protein